MMRCVTPAVLALPAAAVGQGQATWLWSVTTQDGDAIVEPGETASITLEVLMESDVFEHDEIGFGAVNFDTLGGQGAGFGQIVGWQVLNDLDSHTGDTTSTDGVSLFGTMTLQSSSQQTFITDNPIAVFSFEWMPVVLGAYTVEYQTASYWPDKEQQVLVWTGEDLLDMELWPVEEAAISFQVVPAPGARGVLIAGALGASRRRR